MEPILPFQQLLCVVPPRSKVLLPQYLRPLYKKAALAKYYPTTFAIDLEGKTREWEGVALLPFIDLDRIVTAYSHAEKVATEKGQRTQFVRNKLGKSVKYRYSAEKKHNYTSNYGKIRNCTVATKTI